MELLELTPSLQHYIFSFCDADGLFAVSHVCREWKSYAQQEALWFHLSRLNARRAACCTYQLRRGHATLQGTTTADEDAAASQPAVVDDPYVFMFGEAFAYNKPVSASALFSPTTAANATRSTTTTSTDVFEGLRLAESRRSVPLSWTPPGDPPQSAGVDDDGEQPWWPRMACPIPPPPWEASSAHESDWTSLARAGDGGHGGVREFTMRFLRYLAFSLTSTYPTALQVRADDCQDSQTTEARAQPQNSVRYVAGCYYCRFVALNDARHPCGCQRSRDGIALVSPNGFTLCLSPLRDRIGRNNEPRASRPSSPQRPVWYTSLLKHFAIAGERGWQQNVTGGGGGGQSRPSRSCGGAARGFYVADDANVGRGGWGADGSEGIVYPKELSLAFRVEWLPDVADDGNSRGTNDDRPVHNSDDDDDDDEDALAEATVGPSECIIGFIDRQDVWRYERAAVDVLAGRPPAGLDDLPRWLNPTADPAHAMVQWSGTAQPWAKQSHSNAYGGGAGGGSSSEYGANPFEPSAWGGVTRAGGGSGGGGAGGGDDDDVEAEVANWLAATAQDIEARDSRASASRSSTGQTSTGFAPQRTTDATLSAVKSQAKPTAPSSSPYGASQPSTYVPRHEQATSQSRVPGNGGVFIGDTPNGYGFAVRHQSWIHDQHVTALTLNTSEVSVNWGTGFADADAGSDTGSRAVHVVFRFHTEDDCVQLSVNGEDAGTVLVDAFSDGQVWVPAVSVKGSRCAVTVLPPEMVLYD